MGSRAGGPSAHRLARVNVVRRKHWGWGFEDQQPTPAEVRAAAPALADHLGVPFADVEDPVPIGAVELRRPRVAVPGELADICAGDVHARASHALGKSYADIVQGLSRPLRSSPGLRRPPARGGGRRARARVVRGRAVAAIPFGGGTSVVGGVTPAVGPEYNGAVSLDLGALDRVLEVDTVSRAAARSRRVRWARTWSASWRSTA